jgi:hypothetical protein
MIILSLTQDRHHDPALSSTGTPALCSGSAPCQGLKVPRAKKSDKRHLLVGIGCRSRIDSDPGDPDPGSASGRTRN